MLRAEESPVHFQQSGGFVAKGKLLPCERLEQVLDHAATAGLRRRAARHQAHAALYDLAAGM